MSCAGCTILKCDYSRLLDQRDDEHRSYREQIAALRAERDEETAAAAEMRRAYHEWHKTGTFDIEPFERTDAGRYFLERMQTLKVDRDRAEKENETLAAQLRLARAGMPGIGVVEVDSDQTQALREQIHVLQTAVDKVRAVCKAHLAIEGAHESWCVAKGRCTYCDPLNEILEEALVSAPKGEIK